MIPKASGRIWVLIALCLCGNQLSSFAQINPVIPPPPNIKTVVLQPEKEDAYVPIVQLGEKLVLSFDDINAERIQYSYRIQHCDYNWQPSNIAPTEFMTGYDTDRIRQFDNSFNTLQYYTHYRLEIPNQNKRLLISGNYLISVLDERRQVVFTRRFILYEPEVVVAVTAHRSTDAATINEKHSIQFKIDHQNLFLNDPYREIKVDVYQNFDWNSVIKNIKPKFVRGSQLWYNHVDGISYWAGNEYLYFDSKEIRNATNNIFRTRLNNIFNTYLYTNEARNIKPYLFYADINGNFKLRTLDADNVDLEGDYSWVHFSLSYPNQPNDDDIYIYGSFNDWQITPENKMTFNEDTGLFEVKIMMKQGFYNYTHVSVGENLTINPYTIEGSYYQTENDYGVVVYYRKFGDRYDRAIGFGKANSRKLLN